MAKAKSVPSHVARPPTTRGLNALLGESYGAFKALTQRGSAVTGEWRQYSTTSPWVLKVSQGDRTLFYATPKVGAFEVTVVLGQRATEAALTGRVSKKLHATIRAARAYAEGRPVRVLVTGQGDLAGVEQLVAVKLDPNSGAFGRPTPGVYMINATWHKRHPMPMGSTLDQRVKWHVAHAKACGCREIPPTVLKELRRRGTKAPKRRQGSPVARTKRPVARRARVGRV
ncbi:MAG TPA: DUF3788 family protein [Longimicrobiales bacterium]